jgi:Histone chaperone Rttp106-like
LKSSLIFINKPVTYIKLSEIKYVEFSRIGSAGMPSSRSFDMTVAKLTDNSTIAFSGIDKDEYKNLSAYLKGKGVKMRQVDVETNQQYELSDNGAEEDDDDSEAPKSKKRQAAGGDKGGKKQTAAAAMNDYDDEDEDDESFKDEGSAAGSGGEDEEGEDEDEDDEDEGSDDDADMDEGIDKDELKALQKETAGIDLSSSRRTRGGARAAA